MDLRRLDALMAERVLCWKATRDYYSELWQRPDGSRIRCDDWTPTTNIAQAWEVVSHLNHRSAACDFRIHLDHEGLWTCRISWANEAESCTGDALNVSSAPLAICLAALAAKGVSPGR